MDFALALRYIWQRKLWLLPVVGLAITAAALVPYNVSVAPPGLKSKSLESGAAKLGLVLDSRDSTIAPRDVSVAALAQRSVLYAELLKSQPVRKSIGKRTDVPWQTIWVDGQVENPSALAEVSQPNQVQRSAELVNERSSRRIYFTVNSNYPIINLYAQAPTAGAAIRLVQAAANSLADYTSDLQTKLEVPDTRRAELLQLGDPQGGVVAPGANVGVAVIVALAVLLGGCFLILYIPRVVTAVRGANDGEMNDYAALDHAVHQIAAKYEKDWMSDQSQIAPVEQPLPHEAESYPSGHGVEPSRETVPSRPASSRDLSRRPRPWRSR